jgi:hypothetical protein
MWIQILLQTSNIIVSCQTDCLGRAKNGTRTQEVQAPGEEGRRGA